MNKILQHNRNKQIEQPYAGQRQEKDGFSFAVMWLLLFFIFLSLNILNDRFNLEKLEQVYEMVLWVTLPVTAYLIKDRVSQCKEFLVIVSYFAAVWGFGILNPNVRKWNHIMIFVGALGILAAFIILAYSIINNAKRQKALYPEQRKKDAGPNHCDGLIRCRIPVKHYLPVLFVILIFLLCSLETFSEIPHLDSTLYYTKINKLSTNFDYSFRNILSEFCFYKHLSIGYALFALLGEEIQSYTTFGVHLVNFMLALFSGISFYALLEKLYPEMSRLKKTVAFSGYLLSPFVLGTLGYFNIDFPAIYFFVIMISCVFYEKRILAFFAAYAFIFTKEPAIVYYCFFLLGLWITYWLQEEKKSAGTFFLSIWNFIRRYIYELLLVVLWLLSYLQLGSSWAGGVSVELDMSQENMRRFGFTWENLFVKCKQIFVMNFNWLFILIFLASIIILMILLKKIRLKKDAPELINLIFCNKNRRNYRICLVSTLIGVIFFNLVFIDLLNPRYISLGSVIVLLLGLDALLQLLQLWEMCAKKGRAAGNCVGIIATVLIFVQSMVSIDPVSYLVFDPVTYYGKNLFISGYKVCAISERTIYNREYNYFDRAVEKILDEVDYREGDLVFFAGHFPNPYGYQPLVSWDRKARRLRTVENENTVLVDLDRVEIPEEKNPKRIITVLELGQDAKGKECQIVRYRSMAVKYYVQDVE